VPRHLAFFLHGMGQHEDGWETSAVRVLRDVFDDYASLASRSFDDYFDVVALRYSDSFDELTRTWRDAPQDLKSSLTDVSGSARRQIEREIDRVAGWVEVDDSFFWTHAMDVILYRFFSLVRERIDASIAAGIVGRLADDDGAYRGWCVVAHSLGTAVAHNVLNKIYGTPLDDGTTLNVGDTRPTTVMMVANVSRVLQLPGAKVYETRVAPGSVNTGRVCEYYLNARHRLDPFVQPKAFDPDNWPDPFNADNGYYQHLRVGHILNANIHALDHYLKNPRVHVPFFRSILGREVIPRQEYAEACLRFDNETLHGQLDQLREALDQHLPATTDDWRSLIKSVKTFREFLNRFGEGDA
jgi:hypothetical protein